MQKEKHGSAKTAKTALPKKPPRQLATTQRVFAPRPRDDGHAFLLDARHVKDDLAEQLGEEAVGAMTGGGHAAVESFDRVHSEEIGGPFVETSGSEEFADDFDETNPPDAEREPLPIT